jgi:hypothetical protein
MQWFHLKRYNHAKEKKRKEKKRENMDYMAFPLNNKNDIKRLYCISIKKKMSPLIFFIYSSFNF